MDNKLRAWCYRWLPRIFGCHCRDDRSFIVRGRKFPICARCTGELAGMLLCVPISFFVMPPVWACIVLMAPMVLDGGIQLLTAYESTNPRRFVTGLLFGYGGLALFFISVAATFQAGLDLGHHMFA